MASGFGQQKIDLEKGKKALARRGTKRTSQEHWRRQDWIPQTVDDLMEVRSVNDELHIIYRYWGECIGDVQALENYADMMEEKVESLTAALKQLETSTDGGLQRKDKEITRLGDTVKELEQKLVVKEEELRTVTGELEEIKGSPTDLTLLEEEIKGLEEGLAKMKRLARDEGDRARFIKNKLAHVERDLESEKREVTALSAKVTELQEEKDQRSRQTLSASIINCWSYEPIEAVALQPSAATTSAPPALPYAYAQAATQRTVERDESAAEPKQAATINGSSSQTAIPEHNASVEDISENEKADEVTDEEQTWTSALVLHAIPTHWDIMQVAQTLGVGLGEEVVGARWLLNRERRQGKRASSVVVGLNSEIYVPNVFTFRFGRKRATVVPYMFDY